MRKATVLGVLALAGTLASPAFADDYTGFRLVATMGEDHLEGGFAYDPVGYESINTSRFGYGFGAGWALNKWLAVEANVRSGGEFNQNAFSTFVESLDTIPAPPAEDTGGPFFKVRNDLGGVDASVVGSFWIGNKFSVYGRAGFFMWRSETSYKFGDPDSVTVNDAADDSGFAPLFGVGLQTVLDGALVRVEYQQSDVGDLTNGSNFDQRDNTISSFNFSIVWTL